MPCIIFIELESKISSPKYLDMRISFLKTELLKDESGCDSTLTRTLNPRLRAAKQALTMFSYGTHS